MMAKPSECQKQVGPKLGRRPWVGREAKIHKASFTERRLFYLNHPNVVARRAFFPTRQSPYYKVKQGLQ